MSDQTEDLVARYKAESPAREAWRMFRRNWTAMAGLIMLICIIAATLYGQLIYGGNPFEIVWAPHEPPGVTPEFPVGTDYLGRDLMAGLLKGGGLSSAPAASQEVGLEAIRRYRAKVLNEEGSARSGAALVK